MRTLPTLRLIAWPRHRCRSKQRRHASDRDRPKQHLAVRKAQRQGRGLLAFECRALAEGIERRNRTGRRILTRKPAEPRDDPVELIDLRPDIAVLHEALDVERLDCLVEVDHRYLKLAAKLASCGQSERASA